MTREEAINEIRSWDFLNRKEIEAVQTLIPELRESEDERMMRVIGLALMDVPEERFASLGTTLRDCLAHLKKQKENPKSADWLKSLRPSWKPSEGQMVALKLSFEEAFDDAGDCNRYRRLKSLYEQLKKL